MPLCQIELTNKPATFWKALRPPAKDRYNFDIEFPLPTIIFKYLIFKISNLNRCGELLCSLCYHPSNSILTLTLVKARNLKAKDINGKSGTIIFFCNFLQQ